MGFKEHKESPKKTPKAVLISKPFNFVHLAHFSRESPEIRQILSNRACTLNNQKGKQRPQLFDTFGDAPVRSKSTETLSTSLTREWSRNYVNGRNTHTYVNAIRKQHYQKKNRAPDPPERSTSLTSLVNYRTDLKPVNIEEPVGTINTSLFIRPPVNSMAIERPGELGFNRLRLDDALPIQQQTATPTQLEVPRKSPDGYLTPTSTISKGLEILDYLDGILDIMDEGDKQKMDRILKEGVQTLTLPRNHQFVQTLLRKYDHVKLYQNSDFNLKKTKAAPPPPLHTSTIKKSPIMNSNRAHVANIFPGQNYEGNVIENKNYGRPTANYVNLSDCKPKGILKKKAPIPKPRSSKTLSLSVDSENNETVDDTTTSVPLEDSDEEESIVIHF